MNTLSASELICRFVGRFFCACLGLLLLDRDADAANAFPGALGYGANATGGRTGSVYHVTNLNDSGSGSFRDAVSSSNRIVVFDVGGYINLSSAVSAQSNLTIAGQTAPGGGIAISGAELSFANRSNVICRFIRVRPGGASSSSDDCISLYRANNIIFDHCSFDFAKWNNIDAVGDSTAASTNFTVQNCIIANPIGQQFGAHTEMVGGFFSWFNNIFANGHNRQPLAKDNTIFINNTLYNFEDGYTTHTSTRFSHDLINNYFICGPASGSGAYAWFQIDTNQSMYYTGNLLDNNRDSVLNGVTTEPYPGYQGTGTILTSPFSPITTALLSGSTPPLSAANSVLYNMSNVGGLPHDPLEALVVSQVKTLGNGSTGYGVGSAGPGSGLYTSQTQTGLSNNGFGTIANGVALVDSDQDGMPDDWESAKGLNPNSASDGKTTSASGYTNLEDYLDWLAFPHAVVGKNTAAQPNSVDIDLTQYADGFPTGATFTISGVSGGTASQSGTGGYLVHYVPTLNSGPAIGGFTFAVTTGSYTMTETCGVLIQASSGANDLVWKGDSTSNVWDTSNSNWMNSKTSVASSFSGGDRVVFDDSGSHTPSVNLGGVLAPASIEVNTQLQNYTFSGYGWLNGSMALVKNGPGTLTIAPTSATTSATLTSGTNLVVVATTSNLIVGMGVSSSNSGIPSSTTLTAITSATMVTLSKSVTASGANTLTFTPSNSFTGPTTFNAGTIVLGGGGSLGSGALTLNATLTNGAATTTTVTLSNSVVVPSGSQATVNMGNRFALAGSVTGAGTLSLNVQTTLSRDDLTGSFAAFDGTLNLVGNGGVRLMINGGSFDNFGAASVNLGSSVNLQPQTNTGGNTISIGELNGGGLLYGGNQSGATGVATYVVGGLNTSTTFSGRIVDGSSYAALTKTGTGTLTLSSASNSYSGPTTISAGALAALGNYGGIMNVTGGTLLLGTPTTPTGTLTSNGLTLTGSSSIVYGLSSSPNGANDKIVLSGSILTTSSAATIKVNFNDGVLGSGTYNLIAGSGTMSASNTTPVLSTILPAGSRQTLSLTRGSNGTPAFLNLVVAGDAASLTWSGSSGGTWDLTSTQNWNSLAATNAKLFYNFDSVTFDDTSSLGTVTLSGTVQPNLINVANGATAYTFSGAGILAGTGSLVKSGTGTLTLSITGTNSFSGGTTLNGGVLAIANSNAALGTGLVTVNGGTLSLQGVSLNNSMAFSGTSAIIYSSNASIVGTTTNSLSSSGSATVNLSGAGGILTIAGDMSGFTGRFSFGSSTGMLRLNGVSNANFGSDNALFDLGTSSATLANRNGGVTVELGALQGGVNTTLQGRQSASGTTSSTYVIGALNTDNTFVGHIATGGDQLGVNITKIGTGNWTLSGSSSFIGDILVQEGTLTVSGQLGNSGDFEVVGSTLALSGGVITTPVVIVDSDAFLKGTGTINGDLLNQGTLLASTGGTLAVTGNFENDGIMRFTNGSALQVSGTFTNTGVLDLITGLQSLPANFVNTGIVLDSSSVSIQAFSKLGAAFSVTVPASYLGHNYQLQRSATLAGGSWTTVDTKAGTGDPYNNPGASSSLILTDSASTGQSCFYRVLVNP